MHVLLITIADCERHVWIAGGAYDCSYLTDTSNKHGIYEGRHNLCDTGSADCCITCSEVRKVCCCEINHYCMVNQWGYHDDLPFTHFSLTSFLWGIDKKYRPR